MAVYRRPARGRFVLLVVTLLAITIITLDQRGIGSGVIGRVRDAAQDALAPVQDGVGEVLEPVGDFFGGIAHYDDVRRENTRLREQLEEQRGLADSAEGYELQLEQLNDLMELEGTEDIASVAARVVASSPSNFEFTIQIDKGTSSGIAEGMPVVTGRGLVGRVSSASRRRSTILLITDSESQVGVRLVGSGDVGVARGRGSGEPMAVDFVEPTTEVKRREIAVTSGLQQGRYPPNIPVGRVVSARTPPGASQKSLLVEPVVDLKRLSFVRVLQWSPA